MTRKIAKTDNLNKNNTKIPPKNNMYTIKTPNKTIYTFILTFFHICVGTRNFFFKNKRPKSLECVKNIISLHQLS